MPGNTFGQRFRITTFGESHGEMIGVIIDGCPAGLEIDFDFVQKELDRRKPGQSSITTQRKESDTAKFVSGIFNGKTTGAPIAAIIPNEDAREKDYEHLKNTFRPSHADYVYEMKYGIRDYRGGGRSSARETAARVVAGAIAKVLLKKYGITITAYVSKAGEIVLQKNYTELNLEDAEKNIVRCPDETTAQKMIELIEKTRIEGDSIGGIISCVIKNSPAGLGEPVFDKLHADLGKAMLSINAVQGFEYGSGFDGAEKKGSLNNDEFLNKDGKIITKTNFSGGIQGGISNGMDIYFNVAFKPVATIIKAQKSVNKQGEEITLEAKGRHDPCVLPRAVPIVEAMAAIVLADHLLRNRNSKV
ncbi:MAG TPA: chorismate synthase [Bacteroidia bacterium]|nr:chorismate synthase [Bacteroidia bacterium]